jgi:mannose-6-phosphate isomerase-like protein (cupin superfamily)
MEVINLNEKFSKFSDHWNPKLIGTLNGQAVKIAKVKGEFVWHDHKDEDELFHVIKGTLEIHFRDRIETIREGEMIIVPKGVKHKPIAKEEVWILLFEPMNIKHTGDVVHEMTQTKIDKI